MDKNKSGLLFKPNFQLFADETEIEIEGKKYNAGSIKGLLENLSKAQGDLATVQGNLDEMSGKYTTLEEEIRALKNKDKPELEVLQGQFKDLQGKYETRGKELESIQLERREDWLKAAAKSADLEEDFLQDIKITLEDTPETIAQKVKEKVEAVDRILAAKAKKNGIVFKTGKPGQGNEDEDKAYIDKIFGEKNKTKRKKAFDI